MSPIYTIIYNIPDIIEKLLCFYRTYVGSLGISLNKHSLGILSC